ncbi:hypothetical protein B296_00032456 [Ensete ventricosum]|uniref:Uncharacterized protein n=1 Tax=Ensete ventricosum TaxID=4639 RepID=A0A426Y217_ENSVE|nr:hypothetical protein B296_00032456 [Ensete ventricosum]
MKVIPGHHRDGAYKGGITSTSRGSERTLPKEYANRIHNDAKRNGEVATSAQRFICRSSLSHHMPLPQITCADMACYEWIKPRHQSISPFTSCIPRPVYQSFVRVVYLDQSISPLPELIHGANAERSRQVDNRADARALTSEGRSQRVGDLYFD